MNEEIQKCNVRSDIGPCRPNSGKETGEDNPFKLPDDMGPVRRFIMVIGFLFIFLLGIGMSLYGKQPLEEFPFIISSVVYFIWLARWTTWRRAWPRRSPADD